MMAENKANVVAGAPAATGYAFIAPKTAPKPSDAKTALDEKFKGLGYISEKGLVCKYKDSKKQIKDWNKKTIAMLQEDTSATFHVVFDEFLNMEVLKATLDPGATANKIAVGDGTVEGSTYVFNMLTAGKKMRIVIPDGVIAAHDDINFEKTELVTNGVDIECLADENGKYFYIYVDDDTQVAA